MGYETANLSSCITDQPVHSVDEDKLNAEDYAKALCRFIMHASTPVTIGIQGGWGSGKTSLITVIKNMLQKEPDHSALCVMVNAWEHSLFQGQDVRSEVAFSLLSALNDGLAESIKDDKWLDPGATASLEANRDVLEKVISTLKSGATFMGKVGLQMVSNAVGGGDVSQVKLEEKGANMAQRPKMAASIRELRNTLISMISAVTVKGKPVKIVFFIDDLDRVPPATAVEILDITKNIFDLPQCVFVLAIDYEVVVKGLEAKFGPKTRKNEREFRQYFDKIIQIPFTMPLGAFGDNLSELLETSLYELGIINAEADKELLGKLADDAKLATGGLPRSIKRILNTLSLLQHIASAKQKKSAITPVNLSQDIEARFIIVALHINFPEIARRLMERPNFTQWTPEDFDKPWGLDYAGNKPDLDILQKDHLFNDPWEQVVYCLCAKSPWLKVMARNLSRLLNNLLVALGGDEDNATFIPDEGLLKLKDILKSISVVSIDIAPETDLKFNNRDMANSPITGYFADLQDAISKLDKNDIFRAHADEIAAYQNDGYDYRYRLGGKFVYCQFIWDPNENEITIFVVSAKPGKRNDAKEVIEKMRGDYDWDWEGTNFYYYFSSPLTAQDIKEHAKIEELAQATIQLGKAVERAQKKLYA